MATQDATVGFKIAEVQAKIIKLEHEEAVLTTEDRQKLRELRHTLQSLRQDYGIDLED
jgi:diphthamide synthase (EF-2-diphthine--ammonia ligase)